MPYDSNEDLPAPVRHVLPDHAQDIYRATFNSAWRKYSNDEEAVHRIAWAAVKRSYWKMGEHWVAKGGYE